MTTIRTIMIIGAGRMGSGIAQTAAQAGLQVLLTDLDEEVLQRSTGGISRNLRRRIISNQFDERELEPTLRRITTTVDLARCAETDMVIEAAVEDLAVKKEIFEDLGRRTDDSTLLATNTSSLSITEIGSASGCPHRVIGMHFMNPVPRMKLVEIIRGVDTGDQTCERTVELARFLKKEPITVNDYPGFVSNRLLMPMINEAVFCLHEGVAEAEAIDAIMQLGMNHPMGPLALADLIGLDTCLAVMQVLHRDFGDGKYRPCPLLVNMVKAGRLGKKSGQGFYDYRG